MKKFLLMITALAACIACFLTGVETLALHAASYSAETQHNSGVNYNYLSDPKMLTADDENIYLINGSGISCQLLILDIISGQPVTQAIPLNTDTPLFIKYCADNQDNEFIFVFESVTYKVWQKTYDDDQNLILSEVILITELYDINQSQEFKFFDVGFIKETSTFRLFYANDTQYGYNDCTYSDTSDEELTNSSSPLKTLNDYYQIHNITFDGYDGIYISASDTRNNLYIYSESTGTTVNATRFTNMSSFTYIPSRDAFAFISGTLTLFDKKQSTFVPLDSDANIYKTDQSYSPSFIAVTSTEHVFVIDKTKKSIDQYKIIDISSSGTSGIKLEFNRIVAAHLGNDSGFYFQPLSMCLIGEGIYILADNAGQIKLVDSNKGTSADFLSKENLNSVSPKDLTMTFDNYHSVYIYSYETENGQKRIQKFNLAGELENTYTNFTNASGEKENFGKIVQLFTDLNQTIYALDSAKNNIYKLGESGFEVLESYDKIKENSNFPDSPNYKIQAATLSTSASSAVYSEKFDALIVTNIQTTTEVATLLIPLDETKGAEIISIGEIAINKIMLDITCDTLGNFLVLSKTDEDYTISLHKLEFNSELNGGTYSASTTFEEIIDKASVDILNPSICLDKMNGRIYYIGAYHAVESVDLSDTLWSFKGKTHNNAWKDTTNALKLHDSTVATSTSDPIFIIAQAAQTIIYEYPGIGPITLAPRLSVFKVLDYTAKFKLDDTDTLTTFDYSYVIYENKNTGEYCTGYVSRKITEEIEPYNKNLGFVAKNLTNTGRIIYNNTIVYKYPTTDSSLTLCTLGKNYDTSLTIKGVRLSHKVEINSTLVTDVRGFSFYEIRLSRNLSGEYIPDPDNGEYVGYINMNNVIDYDLGPSTKKFVSNATVIIPNSISGIQVYDINLNEIQGELLSNNQQIRIIGTLDKSKQYTFISYYDSVLGQTSEGWIETKYIVPNGMTALQLIAIVILTLATIAGITALIIRLKKRNSRL